MKTIKVGTRGSKLARLQTASVVNALKKKNPDLAFETIVIQSTGDRIQNLALSEIGENGVFTNQLEKALMCCEIDFAVHSMKDLPAVIPDELCLADSPMREDPRDALVLAHPYTGLEDLPKGARIGTGSIRRTRCLAALRPDIQIIPIRGNVDTRLSMVGESLDGVILAAAGLIRAGYGDRISQFFGTDEFVPAPAQGILALELRKDNIQLLSLLNSISDAKSTLAARTERAFLRASGAGCHAPIGAYCRVESDFIYLYGLYGTDDKSQIITGTISGKAEDAEILGQELAKKLISLFKK